MLCPVALQEKTRWEALQLLDSPQGLVGWYLWNQTHGLFLCILDNFFMAPKKHLWSVDIYVYVSAVSVDFSLCDAWLLHVSQGFWINKTSVFQVNNSSHRPHCILIQHDLAGKFQEFSCTSLPSQGGAPWQQWHHREWLYDHHPLPAPDGGKAGQWMEIETKNPCIIS